MVGTVAGRSEQGKQQIDGPVIDRPIGDRRFQPDEHGHDLADSFDTRVRNGDP